ncbi:MAG TPA: iron-sulfur cluster repair di-iron protein [Candidatus Angelobacter sp.]|nr:iron-sulfur cluster repair di-iron protein [Candidatus Angelobacter sp.]
MALSSTQTVRQLATEIPNATRVFEKLGIDYCCGGGKSLEAACAQVKVPVTEVLRTLEQGSVPGEAAATPDFSQASLDELVSYIVSRHHGYVKQEIPRLEKLLSKVVSVHGRNHAELVAIQRVFAALAAELTSHMMKEEMILFPYVTQMEQALESGKRAPRAPFGTVGNPVHMMEMEHEDAGNALKELRSLTSDYTPPPDACFSYNTLFAALKEFETDLHQHIHLENNILFPRAVALEQQPA